MAAVYTLQDGGRKRQQIASTLSFAKHGMSHDGRYFEAQISSSKVVSLGFHDLGVHFKDWANAIVKESRYLLLKRINDTKNGRV